MGDLLKVTCQARDRFGATDEMEYSIDFRPRLIKGDTNKDFLVDISDVIYLLLSLFQKPDLPCDEVCDINKDKKVDVSDAVYLLAYLFTNGPALP